VDDGHLEIELLLETDQRDHDLGVGLHAELLRLDGGLEHGARLHGGDLRIPDAEAAAAEAEHGVELVELVHAVHDLLDGDADLAGEVELLLLRLREELVERRIQETDRGGEAVERLEDPEEVAALVGQELGEGGLAAAGVAGEDHLAHGVDAVALEEHVLGAREADAGGAERDGVGGLLGGVGIRADLEARDLRAPLHELVVVPELLGLAGGLVAVEQAGDDLGGGGLDLAGVDGAGGAVDREEVALGEGLSGDRGDLFVVVDVDGGGAADADLAHLAGDEGGVGGDAAAGGDDAFGGDHAAEVLWGGLGSGEENLLAAGGGCLGAVGIEVDAAGGGAGAGGQALGDDGGLLHLGGVEDGGEELVELVGGVAEDGRLPVDEFLAHHIDGEFERGGCGALAVARLEHEELAVLDGELDVLHVGEVLLKDGADAEELGVGLREVLLQAGDGLGCADSGDDVLALGVDEELAVELVGAVGGVAGEGDAGAGVVAGVAEDHGLDVDGGAPVGGDVVLLAVDDGAVVHPGTEDGAGGSAELVPRVVGEGLAGAFEHEGLEAADELLLVVGGELGVLDVGVVALVLEGVDDGLERLVVLVLALLDAEDHIAVHLDEAAVAVPGEAGVVGGVLEGDDGLVVEAEVENGIHHPGHGFAGAGADGDQQWHAGGGAELCAHDALDVGEAGLHLGLELLGVGALVGVVVGADFGGDSESGRHGQADAGHLVEVGALAAEQGLHGAVAVGLAGAEEVDVLRGLARGGATGGARLLRRGRGLLGGGFLRFGFRRHRGLGLRTMETFGRGAAETAWGMKRDRYSAEVL